MGAERVNLRLDSISMMKPQAMSDALAGSLAWGSDAVLASIGSLWRRLVGNEALGVVVSAEEASRIEREYPGGQVIRVDDVGHVIHDQRPDAWLAALCGLIVR